ncbi:MAG: hypothetical protein QXM81_04380 [Nitrososphaerota archaeon]
MESQGLSEVIQIDKNVRKYWRVKVPKRIAEGAVEAVIELGGERWVVPIDRYGRVYVPSQLRENVGKHKTITLRREGKQVVLRPRPF